MDLDLQNLLHNGNRTLAWLAAVALAAGCTALLVTLYIQLQRLGVRWPGLVRLTRRTWVRRTADALKSRWSRRRSRPVPPPAPARVRPDVSGLATYRASQRPAPQPPQPLPADMAGLEAMDALLRRLRCAAEALEEIALKTGRLSGANAGYDAFANGMDVEYLHRQN
jgi:hypothetical protein